MDSGFDSQFGPVIGWKLIFAMPLERADTARKTSMKTGFLRVARA